MDSVVPRSNITTGVKVEEQSFTWTIDNFPLIRMHKTMIESEKIDIVAGDSTGYPSHWVVHLLERRRADGRWIGIYLKLKNQHQHDHHLSTSHSDIRFTVRNQQGEIIKDEETGPVLIGPKFFHGYDYNNGGALSTGFETFINADDGNFCPERSLAIQITFKMYTPPRSPPKLASSLEVIKERFQVTFSDKLKKDLSGLAKCPVPCSDIKIISNDKVEFPMQKGILAVRSPVFLAMFSSGMIETSSGTLELPDISSKPLKVLHNFLYTGELLPEWSETEVIFELINAAAKYQLQDLLDFLDQTMGKICKAENAMPLLTLARHHSLKVAEDELKEWMSSADSFIQLWNTLGEESDEPEAKKQKVN